MIYTPLCSEMCNHSNGDDEGLSGLLVVHGIKTRYTTCSVHAARGEIRILGFIVTLKDEILPTLHMNTYLGYRVKKSY